MKYSAGGRVAVDGDVAAVIADLSATVADAGWSVEAEGTDPEPYANLTRDDLRLSPGRVIGGMLGTSGGAARKRYAVSTTTA